MVVLFVRFILYNSCSRQCVKGGSILDSSLKKIEKMSIETNSRVSDDVDEEKMFHALKTDGSQS